MCKRICADALCNLLKNLHHIYWAGWWRTQWKKASVATWVRASSFCWCVLRRCRGDGGGLLGWCRHQHAFQPIKAAPSGIEHGPRLPLLMVSLSSSDFERWGRSGLWSAHWPCRRNLNGWLPPQMTKSTTSRSNLDPRCPAAWASLGSVMYRTYRNEQTTICWPTVCVCVSCLWAKQKMIPSKCNSLLQWNVESNDPQPLQHIIVPRKFIRCVLVKYTFWFNWSDNVLGFVTKSLLITRCQQHQVTNTTMKCEGWGYCSPLLASCHSCGRKRWPEWHVWWNASLQRYVLQLRSGNLRNQAAVNSAQQAAVWQTILQKTGLLPNYKWKKGNYTLWI